MARQISSYGATGGHEWTLILSRSPPMPLLTVVAALRAANVVRAGDTPASTIPSAAIACSH